MDWWRKFDNPFLATGDRYNGRFWDRRATFTAGITLLTLILLDFGLDPFSPG